MWLDGRLSTLLYVHELIYPKVVNFAVAIHVPYLFEWMHPMFLEINNIFPTLHLLTVTLICNALVI